MNRTPIEYLTHTWNPLAMLCTPESAGCAHCWHRRRAGMLAGNKAMAPAARTAWSGGAPWLDEFDLDAPRRRHRPAVIGVQFMGDLFHPSVGRSLYDKAREDIWHVMELAAQHEYLVLTKYPKIMACFLQGRAPSKHIWIGVSVEAEGYEERIDDLLAIGWIRSWVSFEPLIGPVELDPLCLLPQYTGDLVNGPCRAWNGLSFVVAGPETGLGARPCEPSWIEAIADVCDQGCVPFFDKRKTGWIRRQLPGLLKAAQR